MAAAPSSLVVVNFFLEALPVERLLDDDIMSADKDLDRLKKSRRSCCLGGGGGGVGGGGGDDDLLKMASSFSHCPS